MLVLKRGVLERVELFTSDGTIVVTVVEVDRGHVRLSFSAPDAVQIQRPEAKNKRPRLRGVPAGREE